MTDILEQQFERLQEHLRDRLSSGDAADAALEEVMVTVEELHVALEELRQQNDELHEAQTALAHERQRFADLFELAPDAYVVTDHAGLMSAANRRARDLLGVSAQEVEGKPLVVFVSRDHRDGFRKMVRTVADGMTLEGGQLVLAPRKGDSVEVVVTILNSPDRDELRWTIRPVTGFTRGESSTDDELLRIAAHDLRAPLAIAEAAAETITTHWERLSTDQITGLTDRIVNASRRASRFLDDLVRLNAALSGKRGAPEQTVIREVLEQARELQVEDSHHIEISCEPSDLTVPLTRLYLDHIVENLVSNAVRHTPPGTNVTLSASMEDERLHLIVADDGPGVKGPSSASLFEPFVRVGRPKGSTSGSGLGLAIVQALAEGHGGRAWAEHPEDGGMAFHVLLRPDA